jgi:hypothetical protein
MRQLDRLNVESRRAMSPGDQLDISDAEFFDLNVPSPFLDTRKARPLLGHASVAVRRKAKGSR